MYALIPKYRAILSHLLKKLSIHIIIIKVVIKLL